MSLRSLLFLLTAAIGFRANAHWKFESTSLTVKVYSCFKKGSDACSEGSGLLIRMGGSYGVITSEHVVLPTNEGPVYHKVVDHEGHEAEAKFVKSSWERGLAVLQLQLSSQTANGWANHWGENTPTWEDFGQSGHGPQGSDEAFYRNWSMGFTAGSKKMRTLSEAKYEGLVEAGSILRKIQVFRFSGIPAEYGMSGGPMVGANGLIGILTHVRFGDEIKTYVIPAQEVYNFMDGREADFITRDFKDFQKQFFSKAKTEIVHHETSRLRIERRADKCVISAEGEVGRIDGLESYFPGLLAVSREMGNRSIRIAQVDKIGGSDCDSKMTLAQFVSLLSRSSSVRITDLESSQEEEGLTPTPHFSSKSRQSVRYALTGRQGKDKMMTDIYGRLYMGVEYTDRTGSQEVNWWDFGSRKAQIITRWNDEYNSSQAFEYQKEAVDTDWYRNLLRDCEKKSGVIEVIATKIGTFKSCRKVDSSGTTWYGPAPILGILGWTSPSGNYSMRIEDADYEGGF